MRTESSLAIYWFKVLTRGKLWAQYPPMPIAGGENEMNAVTRIKRPTYATPRRDTRPPRYLHISTNYAWVAVDPAVPHGSARFVKVGRGTTFRKGA